MSWLRLLGILATALLVLAGCGGRQPDIAVATDHYDFGTIQQGDVVTTEIPVRNTGQADLEIEAVSTSCGCTTARVEPTTIPPGGEGRLIIQYDSGVHPDSGPMLRYVYIASNDPDEPEVEIRVTVQVQPPT